MTLRNILTSLLVITATVIGVLLLSGNPILATVVKVVLIAALASAIVQWFNVRKAARG